MASYFTATSTTATTTLAGGLNVGSGGLVYDRSTGNVGIGTAVPTAKLNFPADTTASGGINFGGDTNLYRVNADELRTDDQLTVAGNIRILGDITQSSSNGTLSIYAGASSRGSQVDFIGGTAVTDPGYLKFRTGVNTGEQPIRMTIDNSGLVGIGTTTPTVSLQVATTTASATTTVEFGKANQGSGAGSCLKMYDAAGTLQYVSIQGGSFVISATSCE